MLPGSLICNVMEKKMCIFCFSLPATRWPRATQTKRDYVSENVFELMVIF